MKKVIATRGRHKLYDDGKKLFVRKAEGNIGIVITYLKHGGKCIMVDYGGSLGKSKFSCYPTSNQALKEFMRTWHY